MGWGGEGGEKEEGRGGRRGGGRRGGGGRQGGGRGSFSAGLGLETALKWLATIISFKHFITMCEVSLSIMLHITANIT